MMGAHTSPETNDATSADDHQENSSLLIHRIKEALATPNTNNAKHAEILADISRLQLSLETPSETIYRIGYQVPSPPRYAHRRSLIHTI